METEKFADNSSSKTEKNEQSGLLERLKVLIQSISGRPKLEVTTHVPPLFMLQSILEGKDPNQQWFYQSRYNRQTGELLSELVHVPDEIIEGSENAAKGKAAHEAGHVAISRYNRFAPQEELNEPGFQGLISSVEERPTDQVVRDRYPGAGLWVEEARKADLTRTPEEIEAITQRLQFVPRAHQLRDLITYGPYFESIPNYYDPSAIKIFEDIRPVLEQIDKTIPAEGASEEVIVQKAKERYRLLREKVWPRVKELVAEDLEIEKILKMIRSQFPADEKGSEDQNQPLVPFPPESLEALKKMLEENQIDPQKSVPLENIPPELMEELKQLFESLPEEIKQQLMKQAQEALEALEKQDAQENEGSLVSEIEDNDRKGEEIKINPNSRVISDEGKAWGNETEAIERRLKELEEKQSDYEKIFDEVSPLISRVYQRLESIFKITERPQWKEGYASGGRLDMNIVNQYEANPALYSKLWERKNKPERHDYAFEILVNISKLMDGQNNERSFRLTVILAEVLNRLGIPFEITSFSSQLEGGTKILKDFAGEHMTNADRDRISSIYGVADGCPNPRQAVEFATGRIKSFGKKDSFLLAIDESCSGGCEYVIHTKDRILDLAREIDGKVIGIGVNSNSDYIKGHYPSHVSADELEALTSELSDIIEDMIVSPEKYHVE